MFYTSIILPNTHVAAQQWLWARQGYTGIKAYCSAPSIATDNSGNVWHTGSFLSIFNIGPDTLVSNGMDAFLITYNNSGNLLWVKQSECAPRAMCQSNYVATDDSGNTYITGFYKGTTVKFGSVTLTGIANQRFVFITKYDKLGNVIWSKQSTTSGSANAFGQSIACDGKGYEYVTGYFSGGSISFDTYTVTSTLPASFLVKYDYNGNALWASQSTGTADSAYSNSVTVSRTGDEYITGYFNGAATFGSTTLTTHLYDIFLAKYDPNGNVLWAEQSHGTNPHPSTSSCDIGMSVAADINDNVYMTGSFADNLSFGSDTIKHIDSTNIFYAKFGPGGNIKWLKQPTPFNGKHNRWYGNSVATDATNHFYLTGDDSPGIGTPVINGDISFYPDSLYGSIFHPTFGGEGQSVLIKFDSSGMALCGSIFDDNIETDFSSCKVNAVASDSTGNYVFMGGVFANANVVLGDTLNFYNDGNLPYTARWTGCTNMNFTSTAASTPSTPCNYTCNGTATVTPIGGTAPYTYFWSTGQTNQTISSLCQGTYSVIVTDAAGYKSIQTVTVTSPAISLIIKHSPDSVCAGGSVNFNASGITTYTWFPATGLSCTTCPNPTATPTATTTYSVTGQDTNHFGCIDTASITVMVTQKPNIIITQSSSSCSGEIVLMATGATTYDWMPSTFLSCSTCANTFCTPTVTTTYTVIGSNNGCPDTTTVTVIPVTPVSLNLKVTPAGDTICPGDTVQLNATGTKVTKWAWTPTLGLSCTTCPNPEASPTVTTTYTLFGYDSAGCDSTVSITIRVAHHLPVIKAFPDTVCIGDSTRLIATGDNSYVWSTSQTNDTIWVKPSVPTTYSVTGTLRGCVSSASLLVNVAPLPVITVSKNDTICQGHSISISASGASTYSWLPNIGLSCYNCPNPTATPTATTTYSVVGISSSGCIGTNTVTLVVTQPPIATIVSSRDTVCSGDTVKLIGGGGGTYQWNNSATTDSIYVTPATLTTYTLTVFKNGCSDTITKTIQVFSASSASIFLSRDSICAGDSTLIIASGATTFQWSTGATTSSIKIAPGTTATYTVITHSQCANDTLIKTVHVIPYPKPLILGKTSICSGKKDTLVASGGSTYKWSTGATSKTIYPVISGTTTITLTAFNGICSKDTTIVITILPSPVVTVNSPNPVCPGDSVTLTASGGGTYHWSTGSNDSILVVDPSITTTYSVTVTNSLGCSSVSSTKVTIIIPTIFACCDSTILLGNSTILYADSSSHYKWYPSTGISCDTCPEIIVSPTITTTYTVIGTDKWGCEAARIITVIVEPPCADFIVPNVFSPNGDNINDQFEVKTRNLTTYSIIIYDRWGKEMYKSTNPDVYWNGNTEGGAPSPTGVYYYIIKSTCKDNSYNKDGFLQLIR